MAIAHRAACDVDGTNASGSVNFTIPVGLTLGDLIVVTTSGVGTGQSTGYLTCADGGSGSAFTKSQDVLMSAGASSIGISVFAKICDDTSAGARGIQVTNQNITRANASCMVFSGAASPVATDGSNSNPDGGSGVNSLSTGSITLTNAGSLIIVTCGQAANDGGSQAFTNATIVGANDLTFLQAGFWLPGSTGAKSATASWATSRRAFASIIAFKPPTAVAKGSFFPFFL